MKKEEYCNIYEEYLRSIFSEFIQVERNLTTRRQDERIYEKGTKFSYLEERKAE